MELDPPMEYVFPSRNVFHSKISCQIFSGYPGQLSGTAPTDFAIRCPRAAYLWSWREIEIWPSTRIVSGLPIQDLAE